jgi:hypothetical protein
VSETLFVEIEADGVRKERRKGEQDGWIDGGIDE